MYNSHMYISTHAPSTEYARDNTHGMNVLHSWPEWAAFVAGMGCIRGTCMLVLFKLSTHLEAVDTQVS